MPAPKMTRARLVLAVAAAAFAALAPAAARAEHEGGEKHAMPSYPALMKTDPAEVAKLMDTDKGGYVTREEFVKFYEALFDRLDRDKNQRVAPAEFTDAG